MTSPTVSVKNTDLTRTCQQLPIDFSAAGLVAALEQCWTAIRTRHPDVPAAVIVVGSGSPARSNQVMKWGHFASLRWQHGDRKLPEVLVSGEGLSRTAAEVFTTLLHEATHGLADARGITDTSRQGRWHNKHFATLAAELGMNADRHDKFGYSVCTLTDQTSTDYQPVITELSTALRAWRHPELVGRTNRRTSNNNGFATECECPRKLRVFLAVFNAGPIWCPVCGEYFLPDDVDRDKFNQDHPLVTQPSPLDGADPATNNEEDDDPMVFYDPNGEKYGLPTYPYKFAPDGYATRRQLRAQDLRPGGQPVAAQILWRRGKRRAYLYLIDRAATKRTATPAQREALHKAMTARRTCPTCKHVKDYYIPRRTGECLDCTPGGTP